MIMVVLASTIAVFFAMNIGASGAAASMGIAYGSGAVKTKKIALLICAAGVILGASIGGGEVVKTLGSKIIPEELISIKIALIILGASAASLFIANLMGIPLSTSEVTVGSVVGVGIAFKIVYLKSLFIIIFFWILIPLVSFFLAFITAKFIRLLEKNTTLLSTKKSKRVLPFLVIVTGFFEAFSAGMNNVANAVSPLVASGVISLQAAILAGGFMIAIGAMLLGGKVVETNGKKITELSLLQGSAVSGIGATLVMAASIFGIPIPHTQVTTCSILGVGFSNKGRTIWQKDIVSRLLKVWVVSPLISLIIAYNSVKLFYDFDGYSVVVVFCVFFATVGSISLLRPIKTKKSILLQKGR